EPASVAATDAGPIGAEAIRLAPIASASPDTPEQTISVEAEDLELLQGFAVSGSAVASGGEWIQLAAGELGEARYTFAGEEGTYDLRIIYFDEDDGIGSLTVFLNDVEVDSWLWNEQLGSPNASLETRRQRFVGELTVAPGDVIRLNGTSDAGERTRVDRLEFSPSIPTDTTGASLRLEAEDFSLQGYGIQDIPIASGGQWIALNTATGTASIEFPLTDGTFDIRVFYYDENDGVTSASLRVDGSLVGSWLWDEELGSSQANSDTLTSELFSDVALLQGSTITLEATRDGSEPARVDYLEFQRK
ncbi:MAG: hypothetical protein AAFY60_11870, partial [Myxococcota bacterium]